MSWLRANVDPLLTMVAYLSVLTFGVASVLVQGYAISCVFGTIAWSCFYHGFRSLLEAQFPKTSLLVDPNDTAWSYAAAFTSFLHQFGVCLVFGLYFLGVHSRDIVWWREGMPGEDWWMRRVEQHLFFATMGYELKDFLRTPFPQIGLVIHHIFTVLGCVLCLLCPGGVGMVSVNCINAQLGSGFFNAFIFYPRRWNFWLFVVAMSVSNAVAIWLFVEFLSLPIAVVWHVCYGIVVFALVVLRQGNLIIMCVDRFRKKDEHVTEGDTETDPLSGPHKPASSGRTLNSPV